jgi:hypothetical protein
MSTDRLYVAAALATILMFILGFWQYRRAMAQRWREQALGIDLTRTQTLDRTTGHLVDLARITNRSAKSVTKVSYQVAVPLHTYHDMKVDGLGGDLAFGALAPGEQGTVRLAYEDPRHAGNTELPPGHLFFTDSDGYEWVRQTEGPLTRPPFVRHRRFIRTWKPNKEKRRQERRARRRREWLRRKAGIH